MTAAAWGWIVDGARRSWKTSAAVDGVHNSEALSTGRPSVFTRESRIIHRVPHSMGKRTV